MNIHNLEQKYIDFSNKTILIRTDFNVPIEKVDDSYYINDHTRIDSAIPTLQNVIKKNPKLIIIVSHLGRPKGKYSEELSLYPIKNYLSIKLNRKIHFLTQYFPLTNLLNYNGIVMLENIRFIKDEENYNENGNSLSEYLSKFADIYINEAFSCSHRKHASIVGINSQYKLAGKLLMNEIGHLIPALSNDDKKTLIIGGSKISDKIELIENLIPTLDNLIIGGAMAFSFLKVLNNLDIGKTLYDDKSVEYVKKIQKLVEEYNSKGGLNLILPVDWVIAENINSEKVFVTNNDIPKNYMGLDIGTESIYLFNQVINSIPKESIIIWNGPMGVFEKKQFSYGTECISKTLVNKKDNKIIIGGGDSASALRKFVLKEEIDEFIDRENHISTGGGASLEFLEGKSLPGLSVLNNIL